MFSMEEKGKPRSGELKFKEGALKEKNPAFSLSKDYQIEKWHKLTNEETKIAFHYCIVRVD